MESEMSSDEYNEEHNFDKLFSNLMLTTEER